MHTENQKHSPNPEIIRSMFSKVAANYDKGNNVLSMGVHHLWRKKLVKYSGAKLGDRVLDCATGTGDLAIEFKQTVGSAGQVTGTDFCAEMLIPAPGKAADKGLDIKFEQADVTDLNYADDSFDISSISFGIRNVGNPVKGLSEMARVTKSGGKVMILEFGQVNIPVFGALYNFYSQNILPKIGGLVTGQKDAYEYLQKSSAAFPCREGFLDLMKETGKFSHVEYITLTGGIAYIYKGTVK
ncbi:bifunctional demethylmenaquinone methyltransferase/2-methoxy-6-polyprenyl-1,4-benzoquinol methylase UbiE [Bdellovibrio sp. HCB209]|uniref:bifunctional demethylmenaquinone methyltransferase/2-methoxy-6-polyprenyl-1,4-benzoquinol methylase UbiE n=1 Tax=Bdellovibrio sp. HCB209 TaxID=3394354 RepID=UPI0039B60A3D